MSEDIVEYMPHKQRNLANYLVHCIQLKLNKKIINNWIILTETLEQFRPLWVKYLAWYVGKRADEELEGTPPALRMITRVSLFCLQILRGLFRKRNISWCIPSRWTRLSIFCRTCGCSFICFSFIHCYRTTWYFWEGDIICHKSFTLHSNLIAFL